MANLKIATVLWALNRQVDETITRLTELRANPEVLSTLAEVKVLLESAMVLSPR